MPTATFRTSFHLAWGLLVYCTVQGWKVLATNLSSVWSYSPVQNSMPKQIVMIDIPTGD